MAIPAGSRPPDFSDPRFVRAIAVRIWQAGIMGSLLVSISIATVLAFGAPAFFVDLSLKDVVGPLVILTTTDFSMLALVGLLVFRRYVRGAFGWITDGRTPSEAEVKRLASTPRFVGTYVAVAWAVSMPVLLILGTAWIDRLVWTAASLQATSLVLVFGTIAAATAAYFMSERTTRPVLSALLPSNTNEWPRTIGVTRRLLLLWVVTSAAPLLVIGFVIARADPTQRSLAGPALVAGSLLLTAIGMVVVAVAGQAITQPIENLRKSIRRVATGDLDAHVAAVEGGEIGLLQAGFNEMLAGLRERERMRDVFGRHVGTEVAKRAMDSEFGTGGESCEATALFVDIIGSTGLAQQKDPDAVVEILNRFFDAVVRVVGAEGGFVNKFQGDGALCIFGAPVAQDDHAARALRAARALAEELAPIGDVAAAIGVSSGVVVAGNVGAIDRYEFTVIGDPVNEASRLTDEAKLRRSHVLVSERTIHAAGDAARGWIRGEAIALRGRSQPTITYSPYD